MQSARRQVDRSPDHRGLVLFVHTPSAQNQIDLGVRLIPSVRTQTADWLTDEGSLDGRAR